MNNSLKSISTECRSLKKTSKNSLKHLTSTAITKSFVMTGFLACAVFAANPARAVSLINGDFETGDLTGWIVFTTANGDNGAGLPTVTSFNTTGSGNSNSAQFRVGRINTSTPEGGGGITQNVTLASGILNLSVDVAGFSGTGNASVGDFTLLLDNSPLDTFITSSISNYIPGNTTLRDTLTASTTVSAGTYSIGIRITRPYDNSLPFLSQNVDNFTISGSATGDTAVPEPFTIIGSLVGGTAAFRMRKKLKSSSKA
jgi:hypothetical protein